MQSESLQCDFLPSNERKTKSSVNSLKEEEVVPNLLSLSITLLCLES